MQGETNLKTLIKSMKPTLNEGHYVFCSLAKQDFENTDIVLFFKEKEGITIICNMYPSICGQKRLHVQRHFCVVDFANSLRLRCRGSDCRFFKRISKK
jgi:hypothetical protein